MKKLTLFLLIFFFVFGTFGTSFGATATSSDPRMQQLYSLLDQLLQRLYQLMQARGWNINQSAIDIIEQQLETNIQTLKYNPNQFIKVISPNGNETIKQGENLTISWQAKNIPANALMNINLKNEHGVVGRIATGINPNTASSYSWNTSRDPIGMSSTIISGQYRLVPFYAIPGQYKLELGVYWPVPVTSENQKGEDGTSGTSDDYFTLTLPNGQMPAVPSINSLSRSSAPDDGTTEITVYGDNFNSETALYFTGSEYRYAYKTVPRSVSSAGDSLVVTISPDFPPPGQYQITASNDTVTRSNFVDFTVLDRN